MEFAVIIGFAGALAAVCLGITVAWSERRSLAHWSFAAGMAILAAESVFSAFSADTILPGEILYWLKWKLFMVSFLPAFWLFFSLTYARGNYREFLAKWKFILAAAFLLPVGLVIGFHEKLFVPIDQSAASNLQLSSLTAPGLALYLLFLVSAIVVLMNLERTFRAAVGTMRWRIKFMIVGLGVLFAVRAYSSSQVLLFRALNLSLQTVNSGALLVACLLIFRSLFRVGHFEVGVYPSHSVLHNSLTVMLAGIYLVIVGVLAKVVTFLGGDSSFTLKAFLVLVSLVLLTMLLLSDRVRLYTKRFVSRHFQRPVYDYRTVWRTFTEGTARRVEQTELCSEIVKLVSQIFQALSVSLWLVDEGKRRLIFSASTSLSQSKAGHLNLDNADAAQVIGALTGRPDPVDLDASKDNWASALRRLHPDEFRKGGNRVCVPMLTGGDLLGVLMIGDRVGGLPFSFQDFDLLKSVSDHAAACLLNIQLSQRLGQARQMEAFQAMSAFFVHDLKNTASTLSLMLENLPIHFNNPEFRADALRGISKTVTHINDLIARLSLLRKDLAVQPREADLNEVVESALSCLEGTPQIAVFKELRPLPRVRLDPSQIHSVITNLLLNARDAVKANGQIRIETSQLNGSLVVSVADNGCGMNADFIERSLFRPFQTTKKQGLGIGMFQCKMIIEAHRGRIEVDSEPGKGTAFRVILPLTQSSSSSSS